MLLGSTTAKAGALVDGSVVLYSRVNEACRTEHLNQMLARAPHLSRSGLDRDLLLRWLRVGKRCGPGRASILSAGRLLFAKV